MSNCRDRYLRCLFELVRRIEADPVLSSLPMVVNTMGFNRGLGVHFITETIKAFRPTTVVSIRSRFQAKNYDMDFESIDVVGNKFNVVECDAVPESAGVQNMQGSEAWGTPEPRKLRDLVMMSFLSRRMPTLSSAVPYKIGWAAIAFQVLHSTHVKAEGIMQLLNGSLVSLGTAEENLVRRDNAHGFGIVDRRHVIECRGFGVVRGVSPANKSIYVVTDVAKEELGAINCLSLGCVRLPDAVLFSQAAATTAAAPYVSSRQAGHENPLREPWMKSSKPRSVFNAT